MASKKKNKVGFDIGIFVIVLVMLLFIGTVIFVLNKDTNEESRLEEENKLLTKLVFSSDRDKDKLNKILDRTVSTGKYQVYEVAYKNYVKDCYSTYISIDELLDSDEYKKYIAIKNFEKDGPEFKTSLDEIRSIKNTLTEELSKFNTCANVDNALTYVSNKDNKSVEFKYYKENLIDSIILKDKDFDTLENNVKNTKDLLDKEEELLLFLKNNAKFWSIINDNIIFYTNSLIDDYEGYLNKLK